MSYQSQVTPTSFCPIHILFATKAAHMISEVFSKEEIKLLSAHLTHEKTIQFMYLCIRLLPLQHTVLLLHLLHSIHFPLVLELLVKIMDLIPSHLLMVYRLLCHFCWMTSHISGLSPLKMISSHVIYIWKSTDMPN
jgi:hypothetical protein